MGKNRKHECDLRLPQTIENDLLLEFQWPSTKMNVNSAHS